MSKYIIKVMYLVQFGMESEHANQSDSRKTLKVKDIVDAGLIPDHTPARASTPGPPRT